MKSNKLILMGVGCAAIAASVLLDLGQTASSILMGIGLGTLIVAVIRGGGC
ncbi:hypothetical protein [Desulfofalx alkaliphila]|uniref:hypothetical protein n=1 Tax=Desulfofalx alkaliphila TaxID=105483 RepID=UPI000B159655|nr:hypothetical protein [Desulfofalx alkaliphila]